MNCLRLFVTDVDRTLLTHGYELPSRVVEALRALRATGVEVVLATARSPEAVRPYAERLGLCELAICFNGGWIGDLVSGRAIYQQAIPREMALDVMRLARTVDANPMWYCDRGVYVLDRSAAVEHEVAVTREQLFAVAEVGDLPGLPGKIMCVRPPPSDPAPFAVLRDHFEKTLSIVGSHVRLLEIGPPGISKRTAIAHVAGLRGIDAAQCAAAGDAENDLGMLRWAAVAVTVANAIPEAQQIAQFVGPSCDDGGLADGVAWLLSHMGG